MLQYSKIISILEKKKTDIIIRELKNMLSSIEDKDLKTKIAVYVGIYEHPYEERIKHKNQSVPVSFNCSDWWLYSLESKRSDIIFYCKGMVANGKLDIKDYNKDIKPIKFESVDLSYLEEDYNDYE